MKLVLSPSDSELATGSLDITRSIAISQSSVVPTELSADLEPGTEFGDYEIIKRLGRGGMGVVYEAEHHPTSRRMALKVMGHSLEDRQARARFLREGRLAASINHPNSVYVYGTEEIEGRPTISMELVDGGTLQQLVRDSGPMQTKAAVDAILQVIDGLEAAHQVGVLHRDIKPNNCFVDLAGAVKVGDFGLSIATTGGDGSALGNEHKSQTEITQIGSFLGTPAYASPEQLRGEPLDHRSDIYAVGVTLFFLLTAKVPFAADNMIQLLARVLDTAAPSVRMIRDDVSDELGHVITKCLQKTPSDRFASYSELRKALLPLSSRVPVPATIGSRFLSGACDIAVISVTMSPITYLFMASGPVSPGEPLVGMSSVLTSFGSIIAMCIYFAACEWKYGKTIGKWLFGLQVVQGQSNPGIKSALIRSCIYVVTPVIPVFLLTLFQLRTNTVFHSGWSVVPAMIVGWTQYILKAGMFVTSRPSNGYATIYDLTSGTRVIQALTVPATRTKPSKVETFEPDAGTKMIGPYHVLQELGKTNAGQLLLGYDAKLLRRVWIHQSNHGESHDWLGDRSLSRQTRLRWLGGQSNDGQAWDTYEVVSGQALLSDDLVDLDWPTAARAIADLSEELAIATKEASLPRGLSVENVWISDSGQIKILPFAIPNAKSTEELPDRSDEPSRDVATQLLRDTAKIYLEHFGPTKTGDLGMSLSDRHDLGQITTALSIGEAQTSIRRLISRRPIRLRYRIAGMVAATLVLPLFTVLSMLMMSMMYSREEAAMPEIGQFKEAIKVHDHVAVGPPYFKIERLQAVKTYINGSFRDVYHDPARMGSIYGQTQFGGFRDGQLESFFSKPSPSREDLEIARREYETIRSELDMPDVKLSIGPALSPDNWIFWTSIAWLETTWLPSLITAILFRGGVLLRMFGLTLVNQRMQPASRLRVFLRMLATGVVPFLIIAGSLALLPQYFRIAHQETLVLSAIGLVSVACLAIVIYRSRKRFFSDRFAGTYVVAR